MLSLNKIKPNLGAKKTSKRLWRWNGSGKWTYCTRWMNGQNCRSGWGVPDWFEGWQTPLFRRMPKLRGFSNAKFKKEYNIVNLDSLEIIAKSWTTEITKEALLEKKVIRRKNLPIKLLWAWTIKSKITVFADKASKTAIEAIQKAWWKVEIIV